jgi:hypothetical protein
MQIYKIVLVLMVLVLSACGVSTTPPTVDTSPAVVPTVATVTDVPPLTPFLVTIRQVRVTADKLTIRPEPSTVGVINYLHAGDIVVVGILVTNDNPDCSEWYPLQSPNGWICADFTEIIK